MPNWVRNKVTFHGETDRLKELRFFVTSAEDNQFDFENIKKTPDQLLNVQSGVYESIAIECALAAKAGNKSCNKYDETAWFNQKFSFDEAVKLGNKYLDNLKKYGCYDWYDWRVKQWGCKWSACDIEWKDDDYVIFDTPWSMPHGIYLALADCFLDVSFEVDFADEDIGSNCGHAEYNMDYEGSNKVEFIDTDEFACEVWDYDYDEMKEAWELE